MNKLTAKQERFVAEYLIDLTATQAAIRAGYSEKTASETGYENLRKPQIAEAVQKALAERSERTEVTQDYVLTTIRDTMERCKQAEPVVYQNGDSVLIDTPDGEMARAYKFDASAVLTLAGASTYTGLTTVTNGAQLILDGTIGGAADGNWWGGCYGWGFTVTVPQTGQQGFWTASRDLADLAAKAALRAAWVP